MLTSIVVNRSIRTSLQKAMIFDQTISSFSSDDEQHKNQAERFSLQQFYFIQTSSLIIERINSLHFHNHLILFFTPNHFNSLLQHPKNDLIPKMFSTIGLHHLHNHDKYLVNSSFAALF